MGFPVSTGLGAGVARRSGRLQFAIVILLGVCFALGVFSFVQPVNATPALVVATPTATATAINSGQSSTLSASFSGGASPYACQWLAEEPGASSFADLGSSSACTSPASTSTGDLMIAGTWSFELQVTGVTTGTSSPVTVSVNGPALALSQTALDAGQVTTVTATVSWTGGTSPYDVWLYSGSSASGCYDMNTVVGVAAYNPLTGLTASPATFEFASPSITTYYCGVVTDKLGMSATTAALAITINPVLTAATLAAPSPSIIDSGQSSTLSTSSSFAGGTSPFTCTWLAKAPLATSYTTVSSVSCSYGSLTASTGTLSTVGVWSFELQVTDGASTPSTVTSTSVTLTVDAALVVATPTASPTAVDQGKGTTLATTFTGGTSTFTCQWLQEAPGTAYYVAASGSAACTSPVSVSALSFSASPLSFPGTWSYELKVTDAASNAITSGSVSVTVNPALSANAITPSSPAVDAYQSLTLTANPSGGVSPYYYQWYVGASSCSSAWPGATSSTFTFEPTSPGTLYFCYKVSDSLYPSSQVPSGQLTVTVKSDVSANAISPSSPIIDVGQSVTLAGSGSGGIPPYSYQWYTSSTCSSGAISGATSASLVVTPTTNTTYYYSATDSSQFPAATPAGDHTACSAGDLVTAHTVPTGAAVAITPNPIDYDSPPSSISVKVTWLHGMPGYSVDLYSGSSPVCSSDTILVGTASSVTAPPQTFSGIATPTSDTYFCATVKDSNGITASSPTVEFVINGHFSAVAPALSKSTVDSGQTATVTATLSWSGGTGPYIVTFYSGSSSVCSSDTTVVPVNGASDPLTGQTGTSASLTFTFVAGSPSTVYYCYEVTDSSAPVITTSSLTSAITINSALVAPVLSITSPGPSPATVDAGQSATLTAADSAPHGSPPYSCQWQEEAPGASSYANLGSSTVCTFPQSATLAPSTLSAIGTYNFQLEVTDSAGAPPVFSNSVVITVDSAPSVLSPGITPAVIDSGQTGTATVTVSFSGGTGPTYTVTLYQGSSSSSCASDNVQVGTPDSVASSPATFSISYPSSTTYYCAAMQDSASTPEIGVSPTPTEFVVNTGLDPKTTLSAACKLTSVDSWTCTATLKGYGDSVLGESVSWAQMNGNGQVSFATGSCNLSSGGTCSLAVSGTKAGGVTIEAIYAGDLVSEGSYGTTRLTVAFAAPRLTVVCGSASVGVGSSMTCTATLRGFAGNVAGEVVTWSLAGRGSASLSTYSCVLDSKGTCSVTFMGLATGKVRIGAAYQGDGVNAASKGLRFVQVRK